ncbi:putative surface exclusion protein [Streptococcus sp. DD10]|nr:putative surface exclusion protein [Streptococcus sp. DD10]
MSALNTAKAKLAEQTAVLASLNEQKAKLLAEKDRLVAEAKALADEIEAYNKAPELLAEAKATLAQKEAELQNKQASYASAVGAVRRISEELASEQAKLAELEDAYAKAKDLEDKAKDNVIAVLPDGTVVAKPNVAPTQDELPAVDLDALDKAIKDGKEFTVDESGKILVSTNGKKTPVIPVKAEGTPVATSVVKTSTPATQTYSRVERAKTLPNTGEKESLLALVGVAILSSLGLTGVKRNRKA